MKTDYHSLAYAVAFGTLSGLVMTSENALRCGDADDALRLLRRALGLIEAFNAMTPDEKAAWYENGHPPLHSPAPVITSTHVITSTPLPGLVPAGEIDAALGRVAGL